MRQTKLTLILLFGFILFGCTKEKRSGVLSTQSATASGPATLSSIQTDVLHLSCAISGCHDNRARPAGSLSLADINTTYDALLNQMSLQATTMKLVVPSDPDHSYLVNKLRGTHLLVGGSGDRMPQYAAALTDGDVERIIQWVTDGAQKN